MAQDGKPPLGSSPVDLDALKSILDGTAKGGPVWPVPKPSQPPPRAKPQQPAPASPSWADKATQAFDRLLGPAPNIGIDGHQWKRKRKPEPPPPHPPEPQGEAPLRPPPPPPPPPRPKHGLAAPLPNAFEAKLSGHFPRGLGLEEEKPPLARWASLNELVQGNWHYEPGAIFLGYRAGQVIARKDDRHLVLVAGSRAGKGVSFILPNLLLWPGSVLAIDPKGELAAKTAGHRSRSQRVIILDPFNASQRGSKDSFNPLLEVDLDSTEAADQAALIADGLIVASHKESHWTDSARQLVQAVVLYVLLARPEQEHNLVAVRALLTLSHEACEPPPVAEGKPTPPIDTQLYRLLSTCRNTAYPDLSDLVASIGKSLMGVPEEERGSFRSTAVTQTAFLDSTAMQNVQWESSFRLRDLKAEKITVYLCLPAKFMGVHSRWLRIIINMALGALEEDSIAPPDPPLLMVLEEFNVLGRMERIATAAGQIAGFGVRLLTVLQDLTQLKNHYRDSWETFIGNAGLFMAFGNADKTTLDYLSGKLGTRTIPVVTRGEVTASAAAAGASGVSTSFRTDPLASPSEVEQAFARERRRMLVLFPGSKPIMLERSISHEDINFKMLLSLP